MLPPPTVRLVLSLALPVLAQQGLHLVVSMSDSIIAGHLAEKGVAILQSAQTTTHYLAWAISSYTVLVTVGSTALVSRFIGAKDTDLARAVTHQSLILALLFAGIATAFGLAGGIRLLVRVLQLKGDAAEYATAYLNIQIGLLVFQVVESAAIACLIGAGDTRTGLYVMMAVAIVNVPLAWCFAFGFGPIPALGFIGIALGTGLAHVIGCLAVLVVMTYGGHELQLEARLAKPRLDLIRRLLRVSLPAGADSLSVVVGQFWFLGIVNQLGDTASAAHGIALRWEALGYLSGHAFGVAAMTMVGQNLGAHRPDLARRGAWLAYALGGSLMTAMGLLFYLAAPAMFLLNTRARPVIDAGVPVLRLVAFAMPALASTIIFTSSLRGAGDTRVPVLFTWTGFFVVRIPLAYYLTRETIDFGAWGSLQGLGLGLYGAWLAMAADIVVRGGFFLFRFVQGHWRHAKV